MRFIKKTASIISSLIIILALGGYFFARNFDLNKYKIHIQQMVTEQTGREFKINGEAKIAISLIPSIEINDVELANSEWAKHKQMLKLKKVEVKLAILPLLKQKIVIDELKIEEAEINLEVNQNGGNNWSFGEGKENYKEITKEQAVDIAQKGKAMGALVLIAKDVVIENSKISFVDGKKETNLIIKNIELETDEYDEPFWLKADALLDNQEIYAKMEINNVNSIINQGKADIKIKLKALNIQSEANGVIEQIFDNPIFAFKGNIYNPADNLKLPETSLDYRIDGNLNMAEVEVENLNLATNEFKGKVKVDWSLPKLEVEANLSTNLFNFNSIGQNSVVAIKMPMIISEAKALEIVPNETINYEYLQMLNAKVKLAAKSVILPNDMVIKDAIIDAVLKNGILDGKNIEFRIDQGKINGNIKIDANQQIWYLKTVSKNLRIQDVRKDLQTDENGTMQVVDGGILDVEANLKTQGKTFRDLSENLDGQVVVLLNKSKIKTGKMDWFTNNIFAQILNTIKVDTSKKTQMDVNCAVVKTDIKDGIAMFPASIVFDGSKLKIVSSGNINLKNDKIDFMIAPSLNELAQGNVAQALASFIKVKGTINNPKIKLDRDKAITTIVGSLATGGMYLGSEVLMNGDEGACYRALENTSFRHVYPKPKGVKNATKQAYKGVSEQTRKTVKDISNIAQGFLGSIKNEMNRGAK